ncbi:peptidase_M14 domain-containing protein, partial [Haematococcus lacustris]
MLSCRCLRLNRHLTRALPPRAPSVVQAMTTAQSMTRACFCPVTGVSISSQQDGGNIEVLDMQQLSSVQLRITPEPFCHTDGRSHFQWFSFQVAGARHQPLAWTIVNAGEVHYAYFAPYSWERHTQLVARTQLHPEVTHRVIGHTLEGRPLDLLQVGSEGEGKKKVWVIARQHPGETMAEFFMEGLLQRLTDCSDPVAHALLTGCVFYTIPNMCPDGSVRGHLRTNAAGANLNRCTLHPSTIALTLTRPYTTPTFTLTKADQ